MRNDWTLALLPLAAAGLVALSACGSETASRTGQVPNRPPTIESLTAEKQTLQARESTRLTAVVRDPDQGPADAGGGAPAPSADDAGRDASTSPDTARADAGAPSDASGGDVGTPSDAGGTDAGSGSDARGSAPPGLSYDWSVEGEGWTIDASGPTATLTAPDRYDTSTTVTLVVTDPEGASSEPAEIEITVGSNGFPEIASLDANPNPVAPGEKTTLSAAASDPNGDELTYNWSSPADWSLASKTGETVELTAPDRAGAVARIELEVDDGHEGAATTSIQIRTSEDRPPSISSMTASPPQADPGGKLDVEVSAVDPEGKQLTYSWSASSNWSVNGSGNTAEVTAPNDYGASGRITATVEDPRGQSVDASLRVSTISNNGPAISQLSASPRQVARGGTVQLKVSATDPNGDPLSYNWSVAKSGWSLTPNKDNAALKAPNKPGKTTEVSVEVSDNTGKTAKATVVVSTIRNRAPTISSVTATPASVAPGGSSALSVGASDPDGDSLSYNWNAPQNWTVNGSGSDVALDAPNSFGKTAVVEVTVTDGHGGQAIGNVTVSTEGNQSPVVSSVTASPTILDKNETTTLKVDASDPNGDSLSYDWTGPSGWNRSGSGAQITATAPDKYGLTATFKVTVKDGNGGRTTETVTVQTRRNQSPFIASLTANPPEVPARRTTTVRVQAGDPDGDSLSYSWNTPKNWSGSSTSASIDLTAPDKYGTSAPVEVTVSDGAASVSKTVTVKTVKNEPPAINKLEATPNPVLQNSTTKATVDARDPYGDKLSYSWTLKGMGWSKSGTGKTITLQSPDKGGSTVEVSVTVDDNHGLTTSDKITVKTSACPSGKANCDGKRGNQCEIDILNDDKNCGACGNVCQGNKVCVTGKCVTWSHRAKVSIDGSGLNNDQSGFPVRIVIPPNSNVYNQAQSDGDDLRFATSKTPQNNFDIPYWVESWNDGGESVVWARVPTVKANQTTDIYMYFGHPGASSTSKFSNVFKDVFKSSGNTTMGGKKTYDWFELKNPHTLSVKDGQKLEIEARKIVVQGTIDGDGAGYDGGNQPNNGQGPGGGGGTGNGASAAGGGGYGGKGGEGGGDGNDSNPGGNAYGSASSTSIRKGSGGGASDYADGGDGGGAVTLDGQYILINGQISMRGEPPPSEGHARNAGGGAGGGLLLMSTTVVHTGSAVLSGGDGGDGSSGANDSGGGGAGGRFKAFYGSTLTNNGSISVAGGAGGTTGANGGDGQNGTTHTEKTAVDARTSIGSVQTR